MLSIENRGPADPATPSPTPAPRKAYRVEAYDNFEFPDCTWMLVGEFDDAPTALIAARKHIRDSLDELQGREARTADDLYGRYLSFGEVATISGLPAGVFNAYDCAHELIREMSGEKQWTSDGWVERRHRPGTGK